MSVNGALLSQLLDHLPAATVGASSLEMLSTSQNQNVASSDDTIALAHLLANQGDRNALAALQSYNDKQQQQQQQQFYAQQAELENLFSRLSHQSNSSATSQPVGLGSPTSPFSDDQSCVPSSITVSPSTEPMQAAACLNFSLSLPGASSFVLHAQAGPAGHQSSLNMALNIALTARKIHATTAQPGEGDLAVLPLLASSNEVTPREGELSEFIDLHVYRCSVPQHACTGQPAAQTTRIDASSSPLLVGMQLAQLLTTTLSAPRGCGVVDVVFGASAAKAALQAVAVARTNLAAAAQDCVCVPQMTDTSSSPTHTWVVRLVHASMLGAPAAPRSARTQTMGPPTSSSAGRNMLANMQRNLSLSSLNLEHAPSLSSLSDAGTGAATPAGGVAGADPQTLLSSVMSNPLLGAPLLHGSSASQYQLHHLHHLATSSSSSHHQHQHQHQQQPLIPSTNLLGSSLPGPGMSTSAMAATGGAAGRARARKADWVIVTEDTAIKNAAGAVAKVLGRVAGQGLCCPVFTEKKTDKYTAVVSVAVKAIAVARGYVVNEGTGHEVAFQPYLRTDGTPGLRPRPHGAPVAPVAVPSAPTAIAAIPHSMSLESLTASTGLDPTMAALLLAASGSPPGSAAGLLGCSPPSTLASGGLGSMGSLSSAAGNALMCEPSGGSGSSGTGAPGEDDAGVCEVARAELAFDVYKVPLVADAAAESGALPVKVTAHSRPGVVSNIIAKLVHEREAAVLITAGGRAMHVAMMAVVVARQRLRARGIDLLLLPKFVTVDTTSTLGWESVFLRFTIIRAPPPNALSRTSVVAASNPSFARMSV